jgi:nitroreductase
MPSCPNFMRVTLPVLIKPIRKKPRPLLYSSSYRHTLRQKKAPRCEQLLSGAAVCQNILIASSARGYRSQWLTEWFAYNDRVKEYLGLATIEEILGFIYIGSETETPKERPRPNVSDIVTRLQL